VLLSLLMAGTLINQHYEYFPTVGSALGVEAQHLVSPQELARERAAHTASGVLPTHGYTISVKIPGAASGFQARNAFVWLPPAWVTHRDLDLPVIELLAGVPGNPSDWTRAGFADETARIFANAHKGVAPILVMPDATGSPGGDTECVNSVRGQAETYLTVDVPAFIREHYEARTGTGSFVVAGLSAGGTCSVMLALRHPDLYVGFGDYSGLTSPTIKETVDADATIKELFDGSRAAYDAHDPVALLRDNEYPFASGWFEVGTEDSEPLRAQHDLVSLAVSAGIQTCSREIPGGGHNFGVWSQAFKDSLPWFSYLLALTPEPSPIPATCRQLG
jgi:S-formylglutathione hydrolase FrmB